MKKRLVFVDQNLDGGGAERILCTLLRSQELSAFEVHLVLCGRLGDLGPLVPPSVRVHELASKSTLMSLPKLILLLWRLRPNVVFSTLHRCMTAVAMARFFCPSFKVVNRCPTLLSREVAEGSLAGWRLLVTRFLLPKSDILIAQTSEMQKDLGSFLNIEADSIEVLVNPLDKKLIDHLACQFNPFTAAEEGCCHLVASGRLEAVKGFDLLIEAFGRVYRRDNRLRLHILGRGRDEYRRELEAIGRSSGCLEAITFHGFVSNPYPYYQHCDAFILSSRREGFPNVLQECLYLGRRVIATDCIEAVADLFEDGANGYLVKSRDVDALEKAIGQWHKLKGRKVLAEDTSAYGRLLEKAAC